MSLDIYLLLFFSPIICYVLSKVITYGVLKQKEQFKAEQAKTNKEKEL